MHSACILAKEDARKSTQRRSEGCRDVTREVATPVQWVEERPLEIVALGLSQAEVRHL